MSHNHQSQRRNDSKNPRGRGTKSKLSARVRSNILTPAQLASFQGLLITYRILLRTNIMTCVTFEPRAVVRRQKAGKISSRDARHERNLYALRSAGAAIDVTPLAECSTRQALKHLQFVRHGMVIFPCDVTMSRIM